MAGGGAGGGSAERWCSAMKGRKREEGDVTNAVDSSRTEMSRNATFRINLSMIFHRAASF
jgi:hypothetical protein